MQCCQGGEKQGAQQIRPLAEDSTASTTILAGTNGGAGSVVAQVGLSPLNNHNSKLLSSQNAKLLTCISLCSASMMSIMQVRQGLLQGIILSEVGYVSAGK